MQVLSRTYFAIIAPMGHNHHHHHHHHAAPESFNLAFSLAIGINLLFTLVEAVYALMANSMSLLADAGHNLGDVLGLALSWGALWLLSKKATDKYSYGFKRTTILAALINAIVLMSTAVAICTESIHKLITPSHVNETIVMIVALVGIFVNGGTAILFAKGQHGDLNIKSAFLHLAFDALISFGVVLTGVAIYFTHWLRLDAIVGIAIAIFIVYGTWSVLKQSVDLILDAVPADVDSKAVEAYLLSFDNIKAVHDLHIWSLSTQEVALTAHVVVPENNLTDALLIEIHEQLANQFHIKHATLQTEVGEIDQCVRQGGCC
jgi:cobalt-zinc-cadmium efflux system protein